MPRPMTPRRQSIRRREMGEGVIYVAEIPGTDIIKIGHSLDAERRVKEVIAYVIGRSDRTELLATIPAPFWLECSLHRVFRRDPASLGNEFYRRDILNHPAMPAGILAALAAKPAEPSRKRTRKAAA